MEIGFIKESATNLSYLFRFWVITGVVIACAFLTAHLSSAADSNPDTWEFMWDVNANLGYTWTQSFSTTIGYRYLKVDYEDGAFLYDVYQDGVVLGLSW